MSDPEPEEIRLVAERFEPFAGKKRLRIRKEKYDSEMGWLYQNAMTVPTEEQLDELRESIDRFLSDEGGE
jgi:hypothetical protein